MGTSIIASVDAPPVPEPAEHALDFVALAQCRQFPLNSLWEGLLSGTEPERLLVGPNPTRKTPHLRRSERPLTGVDRQTKGDRSRLL